MKRNNNSGIAPLTPDFAKCGTVFHPSPDLRVESVLYELLKAEQRRSARLDRKLTKANARVAEFFAKGFAKKLARQFVPKEAK